MISCYGWTFRPETSGNIRRAANTPKYEVVLNRAEPRSPRRPAVPGFGAPYCTVAEIDPPGGSPLGTRAGIVRSNSSSVSACRNAMMSAIS